MAKTWRNTSGGHRPQRITVGIVSGPDDQDRWKWHIDGYVMPAATRTEILDELRHQCGLGKDVSLLIGRDADWPPPTVIP
jgi:hypothetical protein